MNKIVTKKSLKNELSVKLNYTKDEVNKILDCINEESIIKIFTTSSEDEFLTRTALFKGIKYYNSSFDQSINCILKKEKLIYSTDSMLFTGEKFIYINGNGTTIYYTKKSEYLYGILPHKYIAVIKSEKDLCAYNKVQNSKVSYKIVIYLEKVKEPIPLEYIKRKEAKAANEIKIKDKISVVA